jgi:Ulp1 family protease
MKVDEHDLATLENDGWLNDAVIMAFIYRLIEGRQEWAVIDRLLLAEVTFPSWMKVAKRLRTLSVAHLLLPIHDRDHWRLVVVDRAAATIRCYDSLPRADAIRTTLAFVQDVVLRGKLGWTNKVWPAELVEAPRQLDGHNCGPFILWWAKQLVETPGAALSRPAAAWRETVKSALQSDTQKVGHDNVSEEGGAGVRERKRKRKGR